MSEEKTSLRKAAILLAALDSKTADEMLEQLGPEVVVEVLAGQMLRVSAKTLFHIIRETLIDGAHNREPERADQRAISGVLPWVTVTYRHRIITRPRPFG